MSRLSNTVKSFVHTLGHAIPSVRGPQASQSSIADGPLPPPDQTILVLDVSGSMGTRDWLPSRLAAAQAASAQFLHARAEVHASAGIGIVAFSDSGILSCPIVPIEPPDVFLKALAQLGPIGGTNLAAGLETAVKELRRVAGDALASSELVVLTDGHTQLPDRVLEWAVEAKRLGCVIHVVGIGGTPAAVNESLLKATASKDAEERSLYRFIGDRDRLVRHFGAIGGGITR